MSEKERNEENISEEESIKDQVEEILDDAIEEAEEKEGRDEESEATSEKDQLKADLEKEKDKFLRLFAEFENYKRRTSKERVEMFKTARPGRDCGNACRCLMILTAH